MKKFIVFAILSISILSNATPTYPLPTVGGSTNTWGTILNSYLESVKVGFNVKQYGAVGDDTADDTAAFEAAKTAASVAGGRIIVPVGTYKITDAISSFTTPYVSIEGESQRGASVIHFVPTSGKTLFKFDGGSAGRAGNHTVRNITLNTADADGDYTKVAIETSNVDGLYIENVSMVYWNGNNASIGLKLGGRQLITAHNFLFYGDVPISIIQNPHRAVAGYIDIDHSNFNNCYLVSDDGSGNTTGAGPVITVATDINLTNVSFDGYQAWVPLPSANDYGFYWSCTEPAAEHTGTSSGLSFKNVRIEQNTTTTNYLFYIKHNYQLQGLRFENIYGGSLSRGFYLRKIANVSFDNVIHIAAQVALDADATVYPISAKNFWVVAGSLSMGTLEKKFSSGLLGSGQCFIYDRTEAGIPSMPSGLQVNGAFNYAVDAQATDTYVIALTPAPTAYTAGMMIIFKANTANTGACTVNVDSLGAKSLKSLNDTDPADDYIEAGSIVMAVYDGTSFQILSPDNNP